MLLALSSLLLPTPLVAFDGLPLLAAPSSLVIAFVTAAAVTSIVRSLDPESIASLRRVFGLALVSNVVWALPLVLGSLASIASQSRQPSLNEFVIGGFIAWSFWFLVLNGVFVPSMAKSLAIAAIQPLATLLLTWALAPGLGGGATYIVALGLLVLGITAGFLLRFRSFKTAGVGINSLETFQSFLKTWVSHRPTNLENYFSMYSKEEPVTTKVLLATAGERAALVLPGVHPGPFYPVGSYDLSELIFQELRRLGVVPMVLHGVGGHERNLPTNELTKRYAAEVAGVVELSSSLGRVKTMRGPVSAEVGQTTVTALGFGSQVMAFLSNAPNDTDDLDPKTIDGAVAAATEVGVELMLVDAHNSIGGGRAQQPALAKDDWRRIFSSIKGSPEEKFEAGMAHSSEIKFEHGADISDGGIAVLVIKKDAATYALVTSDSNNAAVGLRRMVIDGLKGRKIDLIELCTSDTHKSAARSLTDRGYHALGEDSDLGVLVATIVRLAELAESRLSSGEVTPIASHQTLPLIGEKSLNDFATLTRDALRFARSYARAAGVGILVIFFVALFL